MEKWLFYWFVTIFHFYFTVETGLASGFWTKQFLLLPQATSRLLPGFWWFTHIKDMYMLFPFYLGRVWMALRTFLRGIGNGEWVPKWNTQKRAGMREFLLFIWYLSILIIIIWIIFPPSNGKIPGFFFFP